MRMKRTMIATAVHFACEAMGRDYRNTQKLKAFATGPRLPGRATVRMQQHLADSHV